LREFGSRREKALADEWEDRGPVRQRGMKTKRVPGPRKEIVQEREKVSADIEDLEPWRKSL